MTMRIFWNSFVESINQYFKSLLEWFFYIVVFSIISHLAYDGDETAFATMVASYAMLISIINQRKVNSNAKQISNQ
jgi:hypothetical protein